MSQSEVRCARHDDTLLAGHFPADRNFLSFDTRTCRFTGRPLVVLVISSKYLLKNESNAFLKGKHLITHVAIQLRVAERERRRVCRASTVAAA